MSAGAIVPVAPSFPRDRDRYKSCRGVKSRIVLVFTPCTSKMMPSKIPSTAAREMLTRHRAPSRICDKCFLYRLNYCYYTYICASAYPHPVVLAKKRVGGWKKARAVGRRPNVRMSAEPSVCASRLAFARRDALGARPRALGLLSSRDRTSHHGAFAAKRAIDRARWRGRATARATARRRSRRGVARKRGSAMME